MSKEITITLVNSPIGRSQKQKDTVKALGLHKIRQSVTYKDTPQIRGMVFKVQHLVEVEEVS